MYPLPDLVLAFLLAVDFLYDPAADLLITPLPDLMLGFAVVLLVVLPLAEMYPLPERLTLPDALAALIPVARDVRFLLPPLLTIPLPDLVLAPPLEVVFLYEPADDLLIVPLPDLILGFAAALLGALPLVVMYPLPERLTLPDALAALIPVARDVRFLLPPLLTIPLPDLVLAPPLEVVFLYEPADDLLIVPLPDLILGFALFFDLAEPTLAVLVPLFVETLTMIMRRCHDF